MDQPKRWINEMVYCSTKNLDFNKQGKATLLFQLILQMPF